MPVAFDSRRQGEGLLRTAPPTPRSPRRSPPRWRSGSSSTRNNSFGCSLPMRSRGSGAEAPRIGHQTASCPGVAWHGNRTCWRTRPRAHSSASFQRRHLPRVKERGSFLSRDLSRRMRRRAPCCWWHFHAAWWMLEFSVYLGWGGRSHAPKSVHEAFVNKYEYLTFGNFLSLESQVSWSDGRGYDAADEKMWGIRWCWHEDFCSRIWYSRFSFQGLSSSMVFVLMLRFALSLVNT